MPAFLRRALGDEAAAVVDQARHERDLRAVALALDPENARRVLGHEDVALHAGLRGVGRGRAAGVARRRQRDLRVAELLRLGHRGREAARLEGAGRVAGLVLDEERLEAAARAEAIRGDQRRAAFAERDDVRGILDRHDFVPAPDRARTIRGRERVALEPQVVSREERAAARGADVDAAIALVRRAAARADQVRERGEHVIAGSRRAALTRSGAVRRRKRIASFVPAKILDSRGKRKR